MSAPSVLSLDIRIEDGGWREALPDLETVVARALQAAADHEGASGAVDLLFTGNDEMASLNAKWREKDWPTDVLSFPADAQSSPPGGQRHLGDLALGLGVVEADADKLERALDLHVTHLLVHGFLHLLGYDHISPDDAQVMEGLEARILAPLGLPDPYGETT